VQRIIVGREALLDHLNQIYCKGLVREVALHGALAADAHVRRKGR
jgi:hypothetical protein